jgi:hypothetical protein
MMLKVYWSGDRDNRQLLNLLWNTGSSITTCLFPLCHCLFCLCRHLVRCRVFAKGIYKLTKRVHQVEEDTIHRQLDRGLYGKRPYL